MAIQAGSFEALQTAIANGVTLVDFFADRCGPCKVLGPIINEISEEREDTTVLKVDIDAVPEAAEEYGIMSIPTVMIFKDGEIMGEAIIGVREKQDYLDALDAAHAAVVEDA